MEGQSLDLCESRPVVEDTGAATYAPCAACGAPVRTDNLPWPSPDEHCEACFEVLRAGLPEPDTFSLGVAALDALCGEVE